MNNKLINGIKTNVAMSAVVLVAFALATIPFHLLLGLAELAVAAVVIYVGVRRNRQAQANVRQYMNRISGGLDSARASSLLYTPLPMMVFDMTNREVLWANDLFQSLADSPESLFESAVTDVVPDFATHWLVEGKRECP